jgi:transglutaminase-like putative cysteine protease
VGFVTRRWSAGAAAAAHGGGLLLLSAASVGGHTAYGLPTPATVAAFGRALERAPDAFRAAIVPVPATPELILWAVTGLWIATAVADGLSRRRRTGLSAVLPLTVFPVLVAALGTGRLRAPLTFAFAAGVALYAALDRAAVLPGSARLLRVPSVPRGRREGRSIRVAGAALAVGAAAVALGPAVPGVGRAVVDVHAFGVTLDVSRVELNPLVDIKPQLKAARRTELFTVRATAPAYWRLTALDRFDGRRWSPSRPALYRRAGPMVGGAAPGEQALTQEFLLGALDSPWLPAADRAIRIKASGTRLDRETDSLVTKKGSRSVGAYRVESRRPQGPSARLEAAGAVAGRRAGLDRYLTLPPHFPGAVRELAGRFTAGATTPYDRAAALERQLRAGFVYDEDAAPGGSVDALETFLFRSRRGYCEQFAGAFAAMARAVGLPTRLAVGFTPGTYDEEMGVWRVTTRETHAWPEVFLAGVGWTAFEPTPGRVLPDPATRVRAEPTPQRVAVTGSSGTGGGRASLARVDAGGGTGLDAGPGSRTDGSGGPHRHTLWWAIAAALGLVIVPPAAKTRRRNARRRAPVGEAVLGAWQEALDRLSEVGLDRRGAETPLEFAGRAGAVRPGVAPPLRRLALLVNGAAYGPGTGDGGAEAWAATEQTVRALDAHDPGWVRCRRRLDPRPLLPR